MYFKKINWLLITTGVLMGVGGWTRAAKNELISSNVEALTTSFETKTINGERCAAAELGNPASEADLKKFKSIPRRPTASYSEESYFESFYCTGTKKWVSLPKCKSEYGYAWGTNNYCWESISNFKEAEIPVKIEPY